MDINCGEISLSLNEELLSKKKKSSDVSSQTDKMGSTVDSAAVKNPQKNQAAVLALSKYTSIFPEKVCDFVFLICNGYGLLYISCLFLYYFINEASFFSSFILFYFIV